MKLEMFINPIVLRKAKTLWSFGLSECNRVRYQINSNKSYKYPRGIAFYFTERGGGGGGGGGGEGAGRGGTACNQIMIHA